MPEMHWVITIAFERSDSGIQPTAYCEGTITPGTEQTRQDVFHEVFSVALSKYQERMITPSANPVPLFFSLEPNLLSDTADPVTSIAAPWYPVGSGGSEPR